MGISRRTFLKGSLVAGAGAISAAALAGCAPDSGASSGSSNTDASGQTKGVGKHTWEVVPEPITDIAETKDYDIVIVGGGLAGNSAAVAVLKSACWSAPIVSNFAALMWLLSEVTGSSKMA